MKRRGRKVEGQKGKKGKRNSDSDAAPTKSKVTSKTVSVTDSDSLSEHDSLPQDSDDPDLPLLLQRYFLFTVLRTAFLQLDLSRSTMLAPSLALREMEKVMRESKAFLELRRWAFDNQGEWREGGGEGEEKVPEEEGEDGEGEDGLVEEEDEGRKAP